MKQWSRLKRLFDVDEDGGTPAPQQPPAPPEEVRPLLSQLAQPTPEEPPTATNFPALRSVLERTAGRRDAPAFASAGAADSLLNAGQRASDALAAGFGGRPIGQQHNLGGFVAQLGKMRDDDTDRQRAAAMETPGSAESVRARQLLGATNTGRAMQDALGPKWDTLPASLFTPQALQLFDPYRNTMVDVARGNSQTAARRLELDAQRLASESARKQEERRAQIDGLRAAGVSLSATPSDAEIKTAWDSIGASKRAEIEAKKALRLMGASNALSVAREEREETRKAATEGKKASEGVPVGWEVMPGAAPTKEQKDKFAGGVVARNEMDKLVSRLEGTLSKMSTADRVNPASPLRQLAESQVAQISAAAKERMRLGALSESDYAFMRAIAYNPLSASALVKGDEATAARMRAIREWMDDGANAMAEAYGFRRKNERAGGPVRVQKGGEVLEVEPDDLAAAIADGYEVAQ